MACQYGQISGLARALACGLSLSGFALATPTKALADNGFEGFQHFAGTLNHVSTVEGAESHGALGLKLGLGETVATLPGEEGLAKENFYENADGADAAVVMPTVMIVKGLSVPIDVALVTAFRDNRRVSQVAVVGQWTVFERFTLPAVALRVGLSRFYGLAFAEIESAATDLVASYGVKVFTLYGTYGLGFHRATLHASPHGQAAFLAAGSTGEELKSACGETTYGGGLRVTLFPPFLSLSFEARQGEGDTSLFAVKVGLGH